MESSDYKKGRKSLLKDLLRMGSREVSHHYDSGRFVIYDLDVWDKFCEKTLGRKEYYNLPEEVEEEVEAGGAYEKAAKIANIKQMLKLLGGVAELTNYELRCFLHKSRTDISLEKGELIVLHYCESPHNGDYYNYEETKLLDLPEEFLTLKRLSSFEDELFEECTIYIGQEIKQEKTRDKEKYIQNKTKEAIAKELV